MALTHGMKLRIFLKICLHFNAKKSLLAGKAFDPSTSGLWTQQTFVRTSMLKKAC
jgi:hypothetical protein